MATGSTRYRPDWSSGGITAPSVGDVLLDYADRMAKQQNAGLDRAMREQQVAEEQRRWDIANARVQEKENRELAEKKATQEAMRAVMDPKAYQEQKMAGEQAGIEASLRNLNPQERAVAEQQLKENYDKNLSREQWLTGAVGNANADQAKVLTTQKAVYDIAANTPGTPEYRARVDAELDLAKRKNDISVGGQLSVLGAQKRWEQEKEAKEKAGLTDVYKALMTPAYEKRATNADQIQTVIDRNKGTEAVQEDFGNKMVEFYQSNPMPEGPAKDTAARAYAMNSLKLKEVPVLSTVPAERYEEVMKPKDVYTKEVFSQVDPTKLNASALQALNQRVADLYKEEPKKVEEANKIAGYTKLLNDMGVRTTGVKDSDVLKSMYDNEIEKRYGKSDGKATYGPGAETLAAMNALDVDTWLGNDQRKILDVAKEYKITDKELAKLIEAVDSNGILPTLSGTVREDVIKYIEDNYKKK